MGREGGDKEEEGSLREEVGMEEEVATIIPIKIHRDHSDSAWGFRWVGIFPAIFSIIIISSSSIIVISSISSIINSRSISTSISIITRILDPLPVPRPLPD